MEIGMIGLGRMGGNMTRRLIEKGHRVVVLTSTRKLSTPPPTPAQSHPFP